MQKLVLTHVFKFSAKIIKSLSLWLSNLARRVNGLTLLTPEERKILSRNTIFKDKHKGQRAFVIVNGPSLKDQDITCLANEITFVVSGFYKHDVIKKWQPKYYCILDKTFFNGTESTINFFKQLQESIKESIFFIPLFRGFVANKKNDLLPPGNTYYIATAGPPNSKIAMNGVVQSFAGVGAFALAQAIYMGCSPIYLLGFDHDYLANRGVDRHFYSGGTISGEASVSVPLADRIPYDEEMRMNLWLWRNYRSLDKIARKKGLEIFNATHRGYLDVFKRVDFESIKFNEL
ncbi:MAG: hypothetical protein WD824_00990 [Cyclobacteriaceae bacterium]